MNPLPPVASGMTVAFFIIFRELVARMWHEITSAALIDQVWDTSDHLHQIRARAIFQD